MKKKILAFIFAFIFMFPISFALVGCNNPPPPDGDGDTPPTGTPVSVTTILDAFATKQAPTNFTMSGSTSSEISIEYYENNTITDNPKANEETNGILLKYDNQNYSLFIPDSTEEYVVDGKTYTKTNNSINNNNYFHLTFGQSTTDYANIVTSKDALNTIVSISNFFTKNSVAAVQENDVITLTADFSIKQTLTSLLDIVKNNLDAKLHVVITSIINNIFTTNINFLNCVNEFKNSFTNTTTINDFIIFLSDKVGKDVSPVMEIFYDVFMKNSLNTSVITKKNDIINSNEFIDFGNIQTSSEEITFDDIKTVKMSELVELESGQTAKDVIFDTISDYIDNSEVTLRTFLESTPSDDPSMDMFSILNALNITNGEVKLDVTMDTNYNITAIDLNFVLGYSNLNNSTTGTKTVYDQNYNLVVTNYNTTTVTIPQNILLDSFEYSFDIDQTEISALTEDYSKVLSDIPSMNDFEFSLELYNEQTSDYDEPMVFATYTQETKTLTLDKDVLQLLISKDINYIKLYNDSFALNITITNQE